jgi:hypothetical protein
LSPAAPSYSRCTDQEDHDWKPANSSGDPILKKHITKRAGGEAQGTGHDFKPQYKKKKRKRMLELEKLWLNRNLLPSLPHSRK